VSVVAEVANPVIFDVAIAAEALISALTIVPSAMLVALTVATVPIYAIMLSPLR
jgi:hypothetical protein